MTITEQKRGLTGKNLITVGIFSAVYFVINFIFMLLSGFHPVLWILMPGLIAAFSGVPFLMMCSKVQKPGAVLLMGLIVALFYFVTGQFTVLILITFVIGCGLAELARFLTKYSSKKGNMLSFVCFSLGMIGSPLPAWVMRDSFLSQIASQGMPADYVSSLEALTSQPMLLVLVLAPVIGGLIGAAVAGALFRKHFQKAGIV